MLSPYVKMNFPVEKAAFYWVNCPCFLQTITFWCQTLRKKQISSPYFQKLFKIYFYIEINVEVKKFKFLFKLIMYDSFYGLCDTFFGLLLFLMLQECREGLKVIFLRLLPEEDSVFFFFF